MQFQVGVYYGVANTKTNKRLLQSSNMPPAAGSSLPNVQEQGGIPDPMNLAKAICTEVGI